MPATALSEGAHSIPLAGRAEAVRRLARGMYMVEVTAATDEGQQARAMRPFPVR